MCVGVCVCVCMCVHVHACIYSFLSCLSCSYGFRFVYVCIGILDNVEISDEDFEERIDNPLQEKLFPQEIPLIPSPDWKADVEQEEAIAARERYWKYRRKNNCLWCLQGKDAAKKIKLDPMVAPF